MTKRRKTYSLTIVSPIDGKAVITVRMPTWFMYKHVVRRNPLAWVIA
jgi:hypothetical protein